MADEEQRPARGQELLDAPQAAVGEGLVADRQHLVDQQDVRVGVHRHREPQPHVHAGGVVLDRLLHEVGEAGELDDRVVAAVDLAPREPEDGAVDVDVLAAGDLGVEAGAELDQRGDAAVHHHPPGGRAQDAGDELQQRPLPRAVAADDAEGLAAPDLEAHVLERRDRLLGLEARGQAPLEERALERAQLLAGGGAAVELGEPFDADRWAGRGGRLHAGAHTASTSVSRSRSKTQAPSAQATRLTSAICAQRSGSGQVPSTSVSW